MLTSTKPCGAPGTTIDRIELQRAADDRPLDDVIVTRRSRSSRVLDESAVLDEIVGRQEKNEPLNPADLSESIVGAITEMLSEAFSMSWAFAASLVERHYSGLHAPA